MEGTVFGGKYTVTKRLDSGGAAETWEATDPSGSLVVLKRFSAPDEQWLAALQSNAQAAAAVTHPNVARVLDWGTEGYEFWIVREFVPGTDLATLVGSRGPVAPAQAAKYGAEVAGALSALHGHGLVHGNVKPANVVLTPEGDVKLVGIGTGGVGAALLEPTLPPTAVAYTSPEQVSGGNATPASDVYGLGATLYDLSTGKAPFLGPDAASVGHAVTTLVPTPPSQVLPGVPAAFEAITMRALQKDPTLRYGSAEEMRTELERLSGQTSVMPVVPVAAAAAPAKKPVWPWIVGAVVLLALLALAAWYFLAGNGEKIAVPDVRGLSVPQATAALTTVGLEVGTVGNTAAVDPAYPAGTIASQDPSATAKVPKATKVNILLNGPAMVAVPDVTGQTEASAIQELQAAGLGNAVTQSYDGKVPVGNVISQDPAAGTQSPKGGIISLKISKGTQQIAVPGVVGEKQADATRILTDAGLKVSVKTASTPNVPSGSVMSQTPAEGVTVVAGTTVTITVSTGVGQVKVPDVTNQSQTAASNNLGQQGLKVSVVNPSAPSTWTVSVQTPVGGTSVAPNSTVTITLAAGGTGSGN
jgi:serine/threonine-protein kinase